MSLLDAAGIVTGDIWCNGAFSFESPLKDLLDSGEYTLEDLLAQDELLQELRGVHPQLIDFLSTEEAVTGLVKYATLPPDGVPPPSATSTTSSLVSESLGDNDITEEDEKIPQETMEKSSESPKTKNGANDVASGNADITKSNNHAQEEKDKVFVRYPYMSCEVICCEIKGIIDLLVEGYVSDKKDVSTDREESPGEEASENEGASSLSSRRRILDLFFAMLYDAEAGEIDDYRAGYFDKVLSVLFRSRPEALAEYVNTGGGRGEAALMDAMFKHLYSHSIMQIVQRLMLPQPPLPPNPEDGEDQEQEEDELYSDPMEDADIDGFGAFRCSWPDSETALSHLLDALIEKSPYIDIENDEERRLSLYQNASEVLITIIQNSPLTSPTLHALTTSPVLDRIIRAASTIEEEGSFSQHDSRQTCAMNVLESLILQLGGYGSVATMAYGEDELGVLDDGEGGEGEGEIAQSEKSDENPQESESLKLATSDTLIEKLPYMLSNLSGLLQYSGAESWLSPMQFSKDDPQKILGSSRLRIVRLLESLVLLGDFNVDSKLCDSECLKDCLDLFWEFQWCSMLHQSVANLLVHVFEGANSRAELQSYFLVKCNLMGRLMNSFWEDSNPATQNTSANSADKDTEAAPSSVAAENGSSDDESSLPVVSEDGERQSTNEEDLTVGNTPLEHIPPQSFRLGYMGHVIIICQALVHACSNETMDPSVTETNEDSDVNGETSEYGSTNKDLGESGDDMDARLKEGEERRESLATEGNSVGNPLIIAQLVENHSLRRQWEDFVQSTLASETTIQSTPLGGFPGTGLAMDPLQSHRPGLAEDDGYDDDDGAAPPLPPRGLLVGGDVIDMDDNDLDVAASMMAGLSMGRNGEGNGSDQDLLNGIPQQTGDGPRAGYIFEDPLGDGRFGNFDEGDDSSDEESELSGKSGDSGGAVVEGVSGSADQSTEAPVMDLFAGNFNAFDNDQGETKKPDEDWSDFAQFDNAFEGTNGLSAGDDQPKDNIIDDVFGGAKDHADLLEEAGQPSLVTDSTKEKISENKTSEEIKASS